MLVMGHGGGGLWIPMGGFLPRFFWGGSQDFLSHNLVFGSDAAILPRRNRETAHEALSRKPGVPAGSRYPGSVLAPGNAFFLP